MPEIESAGQPTAAVRAERLQRSLRNLGVLTVALFVLVLGVSVYFYAVNRQLANDGREAHNAVCALREDLVQRIAASRQFLTEHPQGIPGIPAAQIQSNIDSQSRTIAALSTVDCR